VKIPFGLAGFDSATAMLEATSRALAGKDYPAIGHSRLLEWPVRATDFVPVALRRQIYAAATGMEAIAHGSIERVDMEEIAKWATSLYQQPTYPAVFIGSASGALVNLAAALAVPWLPQTFLVALRRSGGGIDDPKGDLAQAWTIGARFLEGNPGVQLHQMHDPSQDRLSLQYVTYFRPKYRQLPKAYVRFMEERLSPGGTIILTECTKRWPTTSVGERYHFQFGAVGGMDAVEYHQSSPRVADYLARYDVGIDRWDPPAPDGEQPEAEWGFEAALRTDVEAFARERGLRLIRLLFDDAENLSAPVADFQRQWNREREIAPDRLLVGSFVLNEPHWALRTGSTPYWATFNSGQSFERLRSYLCGTDPYDEIRMMIFPHGTESVGLPSLQDWKKLLAMARSRGELLGVNERAYPHHFSALARYHMEARKLPGRRELPPPRPLEHFIDFLAAAGDRYPAVRLLAA
jgi:hypothetical protein